jgi:PqqD family protein of HPr-rel-A system
MKNRAKPGIETSDLNGELAVYDCEKDAVHILNPTAKLIYELAVEGRTEAEIAEIMAERFEAGAENDITGDVKKILGELEKKGLIDQSPGASWTGRRRG